MSEPCTVVIGAPELLDALRERAGDNGDVLAFADHDALGALEAITVRQPSIVAVERLFAATSRGAALINRIKADPSLAFAEIRVVSHDGSYSRVSARRASPATPVAATGAAERIRGACTKPQRPPHSTTAARAARRATGWPRGPRDR